MFEFFELLVLQFSLHGKWGFTSSPHHEHTFFSFFFKRTGVWLDFNITSFHPLEIFCILCLTKLNFSKLSAICPIPPQFLPFAVAAFHSSICFALKNCAPHLNHSLLLINFVQNIFGFGLDFRSNWHILCFL